MKEIYYTLRDAQEGFLKFVSDHNLRGKNKMGNYDSMSDPKDYKAEFEKMNEEDQSKAIMNPGHVDEGLWDKAKRASEDAFGKVKYPFVMYLYKKWGGE